MARVELSRLSGLSRSFVSPDQGGGSGGREEAHPLQDAGNGMRRLGDWQDIEDQGRDAEWPSPRFLARLNWVPGDAVNRDKTPKRTQRGGAWANRLDFEMPSNHFRESWRCAAWGSFINSSWCTDDGWSHRGIEPCTENVLLNSGSRKLLCRRTLRWKMQIF